MNLRSTCDHKAELIAQAQAYLHELRTATEAAHKRVYAGVALPLPAPQSFAPEPLAAGSGRPADDPIFATREFDVPEHVLRSG